MAARPQRSFVRRSRSSAAGTARSPTSLLKGLRARRTNDDDRSVSAGELIDYVRDSVPKLTNNKQHPRDFGNMENATKLSDLSKQGITLARFRAFYDSRNGGPLLSRRSRRQTSSCPAQATQDVDAFQAAVRARRLLPNQPEQRLGYPRQTARRTAARADVPAGKRAPRRSGRSGPAGASALSRRRSVAADEERFRRRIADTWKPPCA